MGGLAALGAGIAFGPWISEPTRDSESLLTIPSGPLLLNVPNGTSDTTLCSKHRRRLTALSLQDSLSVCAHARSREVRRGQRVTGTLAPQPPECSVRAGEEGAGMYPTPPTHALPDARTL